MRTESDPGFVEFTNHFQKGDYPIASFKFSASLIVIPRQAVELFFLWKSNREFSSLALMGVEEGVQERWG